MQTYIKTYGCTLNRADSDIMASLIKASGIGIASSEEDADTIVLNTCTVKKQTEQKILYALDRLAKEGKKVVVTGCMASANRDLIAKHAPNAPIVTTSNTDMIVEALLSIDKSSASTFAERRRIDKADLIRATGSVIARVPASEGCLSNCTFCETKLARGPLNSFPEDTIARAVEYCARSGSKEIEITSQDLGAYGFDRYTSAPEPARLERVVLAVAEAACGLHRKGFAIRPAHSFASLDYSHKLLVRHPRNRTRFRCWTTGSGSQKAPPPNRSAPARPRTSSRSRRGRTTGCVWRSILIPVGSRSTKSPWHRSRRVPVAVRGRGGHSRAAPSWFARA